MAHYRFTKGFPCFYHPPQLSPCSNGSASPFNAQAPYFPLFPITLLPNPPWAVLKPHLTISVLRFPYPSLQQSLISSNLPSHFFPKTSNWGSTVISPNGVKPQLPTSVVHFGLNRSIWCNINKSEYCMLLSDPLIKVQL